MSEDPNRKTVVAAADVAKEVTTAAGALTILQDVTFTIAAGESVAVVGVSGSGKSTLLGLLAGLDLPTRGRIDLVGACLNDLDEDGRARLRGDHVGFVFQSFQLLPSLTARENVMLPLELAGSAGAEERAAALLQRVGLGGRLDHYPKHLSGGEQQRVAIARAFPMAPEVLFPDEPTGNLHAATGATVKELLFEHNAEQGTTLVVVTHDEALAEPCGRRIRLDAGRVVADDRQG